MSGSGWGRHSKSCCKTSLGNLAVSTAWQISRGPATLLPQVCEMCFVIYQGQKKWWENGIFTILVLSRLTTLLTWAASLGWTSAVTCCNIYREYHARTCSFDVIILTSILLVPSSLKLSFIWNVTRSHSRIVRWWHFCLNLFYSVYVCCTQEHHGDDPFYIREFHIPMRHYVY